MDGNRRFVAKALATAGALGLGSRIANAAVGEAPLETTRLRLVKFPSVCQAPLFLAEELLRAEGFTDISYDEADVPGAGPGSRRGRAGISRQWLRAETRVRAAGAA